MSVRDVIDRWDREDHERRQQDALRLAGFHQRESDEAARRAAGTARAAQQHASSLQQHASSLADDLHSAERRIEELEQELEEQIAWRSPWLFCPFCGRLRTHGGIAGCVCREKGEEHAHA